MVESVDTRDLKSLAPTGMRVRAPLQVPIKGGKVDWVVGLIVFLLGRYFGFRAGFSNGVNMMLDNLERDGWKIEEDADGTYHYERMYGDYWYESRGL